MRLVQGGSRRLRHLYVRSGYLAILMVILLISLLGPAQSLRELAQRGANAFTIVAFGQVALICLLTPVFMAGAISQEANPRTWDILLTTPLNSAQIVFGNLFGRLFFVLALLLSSLPLFLFIQYFGGVPGDSILLSYLVAGCSAFLVAAIAVTLSVTRTAGRRVERRGAVVCSERRRGSGGSAAALQYWGRLCLCAVGLRELIRQGGDV